MRGFASTSREQIRQIQRELGLTTIFVTHDQEEALTMSDRIFLMNQGKIVQSGDAETLYTAPVDVFAAGFIGNYNLLDADSATKLLQRPITHRIAIRPEAIELSLNGELDAQNPQPQPVGQRDSLPGRSPGRGIGGGCAEPLGGRSAPRWSASGTFHRSDGPV